MSKEEFINRHGHKANLNTIDLSDVSVENDGIVHHTSETDTTDKKPKPVRSSRTFKWGKRHTLITAIVVLLLVGVPVLAGEVLAANYRSGADSVHSRLEKLVTDKILPAQKAGTIKASTVSEASAAIDDLRSSTCGGGLADNLAMLYPRAKSAHDDCIRRTNQLSDLSSNLKKFESHARYIESVVAAAKTVTTPGTEPYAVVSAQQTNWQQARDAIDKLHAPSDWRTQHDDLKKGFKTIAAGWSALNSATDAHDKAAFEAAEKSLNSGYESIRKIVDQLDIALLKTQSDVTAVYQNI